MNGFWDRLGISTSILCILHCLLTPVLVVFVPFAGHAFAHGWFHALIVAIVLPVAVIALWSGYRLHRRPRVLWLGGVGLVVIGLAMTFGNHDLRYEFSLMSVGGILLTAAHYINLRSCQGSHH